MEETAEWCKEYTTFDTIKGRDMMQNMKVASSPETYAVPDYNEHIPVNVINAEEKYKKKFFNKHSSDYSGLKMKKASSPHYFDRFKFALKNIINKDVDDDSKRLEKKTK